MTIGNFFFFKKTNSVIICNSFKYVIIDRVILADWDSKGIIFVSFRVIRLHWIILLPRTHTRSSKYPFLFSFFSVV